MYTCVYVYIYIYIYIYIHIHLYEELMLGWLETRLAQIALDYLKLAYTA